MVQHLSHILLQTAGLLFGFSYGICYTCAISFAAPPYSYGPLIVGAILLCFGAGEVPDLHGHPTCPDC